MPGSQRLFGLMLAAGLAPVVRFFAKSWILKAGEAKGPAPLNAGAAAYVVALVWSKDTRPVRVCPPATLCASVTESNPPEQMMTRVFTRAPCFDRVGCDRIGSRADERTRTKQMNAGPQ